MVEQLIECLLEIIKEEFNYVIIGTITDLTNIREETVIDDLDLVEMLMELEARLDLDFDLPDIPDSIFKMNIREFCIFLNSVIK